jgi:hypothetical protein
LTREVAMLREEIDNLVEAESKRAEELAQSANTVRAIDLKMLPLSSVTDCKAL